MNKSESITHLATALAKAQAEMPVAVFDATNPFLKSKYASLGAVIQASRPILAKHKLSLVQFPISEIRHLTPAQSISQCAAPHPACGHLLPRAEKESSPVEAERVQAALATAARGDSRPTEFIGVESILAHESGEFVAERIVIPLVEEKGKTKVQSAGSTLTYLRRYSWASILGMYSDEDSDGGSATGLLVRPPGHHAPKPPGSGSTTGNHSAKSAQQQRPTLPPPPGKQFQNN